MSTSEKERTPEPTLSILIPTAGNGDIPHVLHSISQQDLHPFDDVIIIADGAQPFIRASIEAIRDTETFRCSIRYLESQRTNDFGHSQLNEALKEATGNYIMIQDDDDIFLPRSFEVVRAATRASEAVGERLPHIFRFYTNDHWLVWNPQDEHRIEETLIGSHNLVVPNDLSRLGRFTPRYRGDFDWTKSTLSFYPSTKWQWHTEIITRQRPNRTVLDWPLDGRDTSRLFPSIETVHPKRFWGFKFTDREIPNSPPIGHAVIWKTDEGMFFDFSLTPEGAGKGFLRWIAQHTLDACQGDARFGGDLTAEKEALLYELGVRNGLYQWP